MQLRTRRASVSAGGRGTWRIWLPAKLPATPRTIVGPWITNWCNFYARACHTPIMCEAGGTAGLCKEIAPARPHVEVNGHTIVPGVAGGFAGGHICHVRWVPVESDALRIRPICSGGPDLGPVSGPCSCTATCRAQAHQGYGIPPGPLCTTLWCPSTPSPPPFMPPPPTPTHIHSTNTEHTLLGLLGNPRFFRRPPTPVGMYYMLYLPLPLTTPPFLHKEVFGRADNRRRTTPSPLGPPPPKTPSPPFFPF